MRFDEEYRGYLIRYRRRKGWIANIWEPSAYLRLEQVPFASDAEGRDILRERVRALIDHLIASGAPGKRWPDLAPPATA